MQGCISVGKPGQPPQGVLCLGQQGCGTIGIIPTVKAGHSLLHTVGEFLRILQDLAPLLQGLVLPCFQICLLDLGNLIFQGFHPAQLLAFVHGHPVDLAAQGGHLLIASAVRCQLFLAVSKGIQEGQVIIFIKQRSRIMLSVDIDQLNTQFPQNRHGYQAAIDPADILAIQMDLAHDHSLRIIFHPVFFKPGKLRHITKYSPDGCHAGTGADHIPVGPFAKNGGNGIDNDGFTCTGLTGEDIESLIEGNIRTFDHGNIFYVQQTQHGSILLTSIQQILDFTAESCGGIGVPHDDKHRIVTGQSTQHHTHAHGIHGRSRRRGKARQSVDHHHVLGIVVTNNTFPENGIQSGREGAGYILGRHGIPVCAKGSQFLHDPQFFDISGNGCLGGGETGGFQFLEQMLLGFHIGGGDDLHDFCLSLTFHRSFSLHDLKLGVDNIVKTAVLQPHQLGFLLRLADRSHIAHIQTNGLAAIHR